MAKDAGQSKGSGQRKDRGSRKASKLQPEVYEAELYRLQAEFVKVQEWVKAEGKRVVVVCECRDAAGKGGTIKRITQYLSPASPPSPRYRHRARARAASGTSSAPSSTSRQQGGIVLFDRSWYNRAGVERDPGLSVRAGRSRRASSR